MWKYDSMRVRNPFGENKRQQEILEKKKIDATFGASAPLKVLQKEIGFTKDRVIGAALQQLERSR